MSHRAPTTNAESTSSSAGRADCGNGNESSCSDKLASASRDSTTKGTEPSSSDELASASSSRGSVTERTEPPSSDGLDGASRCSDTKGKGACVIEEVEEGLQKDDGPHIASTGRHGMAKGACVLEEVVQEEEEEEELKKRVEKRITRKEMESLSDIEIEKKFACGDFDEEDVSAPADKDLVSLQFHGISDEQNYIILKDLDSKTVMSRIEKIMRLNADKILEGIGFSFDIPKRGTMTMTFHEGHQQLVIKRGETLVREFTCDETRHMAATTAFVLSKIFDALEEGVTITNQDLFSCGEKYFKEIEVSDAILYDACCMLGCTMSSLNVVSTAKGFVTGPVTLRFKNGYSVNCSEKSLGGMRIPNNPLEVEIEIEKHEVDFILVLEKSSMFHHLCQMDFHTENKCIMITGDGEPDVATLAFLKMLVDVTHLKTYALVDPDAYGVQVLCTYAFGSTKMLDDTLGFAVPSICWLGILPGDLISLTELDCSRFPNCSLKEQKILNSVIKHRRMVLPNLWIQMIEQLAYENTKASFESLHSLGFGYLSKVFIPKLLRRIETQTLSDVSEVTSPEGRVDP
ncbi:unnamed protein product [Urochloa humidicola]